MHINPLPYIVFNGVTHVTSRMLSIVDELHLNIVRPRPDPRRSHIEVHSLYNRVILSELATVCPTQEKGVINADLNGHRITSRTSVFAPSTHRASPTTQLRTNSL